MWWRWGSAAWQRQADRSDRAWTTATLRDDEMPRSGSRFGMPLLSASGASNRLDDIIVSWNDVGETQMWSLAMSTLILPIHRLGLRRLQAIFESGKPTGMLSGLHAASRFPATPVDFETSRINNQRKLRTAMREAGTEIVLDSEAAELAVAAKFAGHSRRAPWALREGTLGPDHYQSGSESDVIGQIARFAVDTQVRTVALMKRLDNHHGKSQQTQTAFQRLHERRGDDAPRARSIEQRDSRGRVIGERRPCA